MKLSHETASLAGLLFLAAGGRQLAKKIDDQVNAMLDEHAREIAQFPVDMIAEARRLIDVEDRKYRWSQGWHQYRRDIMACLWNLRAERDRRASSLKRLEREKIEEKVRNIRRELQHNPQNGQAKASLANWEAKLRRLEKSG